MTISKQKLALALTLTLLSAVPAQAGTEQQETQNTETAVSDRKARLEAQHAAAIAAGLRPTLTLVDLDAEVGPALSTEDQDSQPHEYDFERPRIVRVAPILILPTKEVIAATALSSFLAGLYVQNAVHERGGMDLH